MKPAASEGLWRAAEENRLHNRDLREFVTVQPRDPEDGDEDCVCESSEGGDGSSASALVKKGRHWPKHAPGDAVKEHFNNQPVGSVGAWGGASDEVPFHPFGVKDHSFTVDKIGEIATAPKSHQTREPSLTHAQLREVATSSNRKRHRPPKNHSLLTNRSTQKHPARLPRSPLRKFLPVANASRSGPKRPRLSAAASKTIAKKC
jgi:hypothetical protein